MLGSFVGGSALCVIKKESTPRGNSMGFLFFRLLFFLFCIRALKPPGVSLADFKEIILFPAAPHAAAAKSLQSCPTLCDPIDSSPPGSTVPGILQARTLECVAISSNA